MNNQEVNHRTDILQESITLINGDRNDSYGDPTHDFQTTATFWQTYLERTIKARGVFDIKPHDIAIMMDLLKIARISWTPEKRDHWADLGGYTGLGWDCVQRQDADPQGSQRPDEKYV